MWIAYCLVHKATKLCEFSVLEEFGVALRWQSLRHLVLSQKLSIDAAQHVVELRALFVPLSDLRDLVGRVGDAHEDHPHLREE